MSENSITYGGGYIGFTYCRRCGLMISPPMTLCDVCRSLPDAPTPYAISYCGVCLSKQSIIDRQAAEIGKLKEEKESIGRSCVAWGVKVSELLKEIADLKAKNERLRRYVSDFCSEDFDLEIELKRGKP